MSILFSEEFINDLEKIYLFIKEDSKINADDFINKLINEINKIPFMPYRFRKNSKANKENIRDLIYKGYIIPFAIKDDNIRILAIFKQNNSYWS